MRDLIRAATGVGVAVLCAMIVSSPVAASGPATVEPPDTPPATAEPTPPDTTPPDTTTSPPDETLVGAGDPDGEIDGSVAAIAVVGFLVLLAIASWWMVRRYDPDREPMPPRPPGDPPPSDLV